VLEDVMALLVVVIILELDEPPLPVTLNRFLQS
jgi:hypothetical protein